MVITLETDYAVCIMELLAHTKKRVDARTIAEKTRVTQRFTLKILHKLVKSGLVVSFKGAHGGYLLARPPKEITLLQVIEAVEGPYMFSRCHQQEYSCDHGSTTSCCFHKIYDEVTALVRNKLRSYTFADILSSDGSADGVPQQL